MSNDELVAEIRKKFCNFMAEAEGVQNYLERILERAKAGKASQTEIDNFVDALGYRLSETIQEVLGASDLQLTAEDYEEILGSVLHDNYDLVNKICAESQKRIDMQNNLSIRPQKADFPAERVRKIASAAAEPGISDEKKQRRLDSPIRNITRSFQDDFAKENAEFRTNAGIKCKIIRTTDGHCCDWCSALAGTYDYATAPEMVFHRHDNCGCSVVFENGRIHQDVWSKKYLSDDDVEERKQYGMRGPSRFTNQEALALQEKNLAGLDKFENGDIIEARKQVSGALNPDSKKAFEHAKKYYSTVRKMKTDVKRISENTGFSEEDISKIKDFVFMQKHDLGGFEPEYFFPDYDMAQSWQRLIDGKNIQKHDITLLNHEMKERSLMEQGLPQDEAHEIAQSEFDYREECREYHAKTDKHNSKG